MPPEFLGAWGGEAPTYDKIPVTNYWETKVDLTTDQVLSHEPCPSSSYCVEHPHVHPDYESAFEGDSAPRYSYMSISNSVGLGFGNFIIFRNRRENFSEISDQSLPKSNSADEI